MNRLDRSLIADLPSFQGMSPAELDRVVSHARALRIAKERPVFEQQFDAHSFFLLLDGHVRVVKTTPDGEEVIVRWLPTLDPQGVLALWEHSAAVDDPLRRRQLPSGIWHRSHLSPWANAGLGRDLQCSTPSDHHPVVPFRLECAAPEVATRLQLLEKEYWFARQ